MKFNFGSSVCLQLKVLLPKFTGAMEWFWAGLNTGRKAFNEALKFADVESEPKVLQCVTWLNANFFLYTNGG